MRAVISKGDVCMSKDVLRKDVIAIFTAVLVGMGIGVAISGNIPVGRVEAAKYNMESGFTMVKEYPTEGFVVYRHDETGVYYLCTGKPGALCSVTPLLDKEGKLFD